MSSSNQSRSEQDAEQENSAIGHDAARAALPLFSYVVYCVALLISIAVGLSALNSIRTWMASPEAWKAADEADLLLAVVGGLFGLIGAAGNALLVLRHRFGSTLGKVFVVLLVAVFCASAVKVTARAAIGSTAWWQDIAALAAIWGLFFLLYVWALLQGIRCSIRS